MPATRACVSSAYTYVYVLYNVKSGGRQRERHEHTSSAVGGCYIVVARLSVEGPLSNRFDDGWRASSAHCNAVTCPRTKIFTNYRIKMEIAHKAGKKMTRKGTNRGEHPPFFYGLIESLSLFVQSFFAEMAIFNSSRHFFATILDHSCIN